MRLTVSALLSAAVLAALPAPGHGQDVEMLAERYGTPLPEAYLRTRAAFPDAFRFTRGRAVRLRERLQALGRTQVRTGGVGPLAILGPRDGAVVGDFRIPVVLGLFADSPPGVIPFPMEQVQEAYFGGSPGSITAYYEEVSGGRVTLQGELHEWVRSSVSQAQATGGQSGLSVGTTGPFIADLLDRMPADTDWGQYDNDGPDGVPNSGDDDGFVDALAVLQPTAGAECGGSGKDDRIWSHRWSMRFANRAVYVTPTPAAGGGFIQIDDYLIQPVYTCNQSGLNEIGVFTHELGHAFGLPDLYDTNDRNGKHQGAGNWDLMATGSWGCDGADADSPCHMSAWSKMVLGWADLEILPLGTDLGTLTLPPVETTGKVYRVDAADDSGEFYLLENRQALGFDRSVPGEGLLVWRVHQKIVDAQWAGNEVNAYQQLGVWLREADGLNEIARNGCGRGNAGDPFPFVGPMTGCGGVTVEGENRVFHAGSNPSSLTDEGDASGVTLLDIQRQGEDVTFRVSTRFNQVAVRSVGDEGAGGLFTVDGAVRTEAEVTFSSAPFQVHTVEAAPGEALGEGVRRPFTGWMDDAEAPRVRTIQTELDDVALVAGYGGEQVELAVTVTGGQGDVEPGSFSTEPDAPDLWFPRGTTVTLAAEPVRGFSFVRWTGALEGKPNPAVVTVDEPLQAGAEFELIYRVASSTVHIPAARDPMVDLVPENGTPPYQWTLLEGPLPAGIGLSHTGRLSGAAMETGAFPLTLRVIDAVGLLAAGTFTLQVDEPDFPVSLLAQKFLLAGESLTPAQADFLDRHGNADGTYDLGDFRAWVLAHPGLALTAAMEALVGPRTVVIPTVPAGVRPGGQP